MRAIDEFFAAAAGRAALLPPLTGNALAHQLRFVRNPR
jgi:hypothetical protein